MVREVTMKILFNLLAILVLAGAVQAGGHVNGVRVSNGYRNSVRVVSSGCYSQPVAVYSQPVAIVQPVEVVNEVQVQVASPVYNQVQVATPVYTQTYLPT